MSRLPRICFGQQPCGFFPKRFLVSKVLTARRLQQQIGGEVIFFYHDSDSDYRETITVLRDRATGAEVRLNFTWINKIQRRYAPMYCRRIPATWRTFIMRQLPRFVDQPLIELVAGINEPLVADFCLAMYQAMGLLEGVRVVRSSDPAFREAALDLSDDYYADVPYAGETVRARCRGGQWYLERGGGLEIPLPPSSVRKRQISAARDARFTWMQSVLGCTQYVFGEGEREYLRPADFPDVTFVARAAMTQPESAWIDWPESLHQESRMTHDV